MATRRIEDLHPRFQPLVRRFLQACKAAGHDIIVTCGRRTPEDQEQLYAQGRTRPGPIVTNVREPSWHCFGLAIDVVFVMGGKAWWSGPWEAIGRIGESLGMTWGGRWKMRDNPHFEWHPGLVAEQARRHVLGGGSIETLPLRG